MNREFKILRGVSKTRAEQGKIFYTCMNYQNETERVQAKIRRLCREAGGDYADELFLFLTTDISWQKLTTDYFISEATLCRIRRRFYELW